MGVAAAPRRSQSPIKIRVVNPPGISGQADHVYRFRRNAVSHPNRNAWPETSAASRNIYVLGTRPGSKLGRCDRRACAARPLRSPCGRLSRLTVVSIASQAPSFGWFPLGRPQLGPPCCSPASNEQRRQCDRVEILRERCPDGALAAQSPGLRGAPYHPLLNLGTRLAPLALMVRDNPTGWF
jgi:hypothetical protein